MSQMPTEIVMSLLDGLGDYLHNGNLEDRLTKEYVGELDRLYWQFASGNWDVVDHKADTPTAALDKRA
jgi:hypothetical protein